MKIRREFLSYVVPSLLAFALSGVYCIVDGFFIGRALGDDGLAAVNIAYPAAAFIQAAGTGAGLAGAIRYTLLIAQNRRSEAADCFAGAVALLLALSLAMTAAFFALTRPLLVLMGAEGRVLELGREYLRIIALGALFQAMATGLVPFIRNLGGARFAMGAMIAGFLSNAALDYAFVWLIEGGMAGAAWATITGQAVTMLAAVFYLARRRAQLSGDVRRAAKYILPILKLGVSPFGLTFSPQITALLMNRFLMLWGGARGVAVYACISYVVYIAYLLLQGVGDGSQPLISRFSGMGDREGVRRVGRLAYAGALGIALLCAAAFVLLRGHVGPLFGASGRTAEDTERLLPLFAAALPFVALTRVAASGLYAAGKALASYVLVYAEPLLTLALVLLLPGPAGLELVGVWAAVPLSQLLAALAGAIVTAMDRNKG